jgi:hypothetical protein
MTLARLVWPKAGGNYQSCWSEVNENEETERAEQGR